MKHENEVMCSTEARSIVVIGWVSLTIFRFRDGAEDTGNPLDLAIVLYSRLVQIKELSFQTASKDRKID